MLLQLSMTVRLPVQVSYWDYGGYDNTTLVYDSLKGSATL